MIQCTLWLYRIPVQWRPRRFLWVSENQNLTPGEWYHIAGTFDGTTLRCYLNGVETDTNLLSAIKSGNATLFIGQVGWGNIFNGVVDELKIYNRALSVEEVQADYEAGFMELNTLSGTVTSSRHKRNSRCKRYTSYT